MNTGTLIWLIIFAISATVFFIVAAIVSVKGVGDLRDLLSASEPADRETDGGEQVNSPRLEPPQ